MAIPPTSHENTLGPFQLLRVLGEGGMGTVYLGLDPALNRHVAIKVLRSHAMARNSATIAKRFLREAQSAAKLNHPHVVTIYSVGRHGGDDALGLPYIVMEYVEGGSLADRIRRHSPLHWRDAALALRDALRGLAAAHRAGIVHRDIKPANLMCARDAAGTHIIKLADFGLARLANPSDAELTFPGAFVGSPGYSAPEQITGILHMDGRADLYSLAATAYALLTGQPPFIGDDPHEIMERHLKEPFPDVRILAPAVHPALQALITRASRKQPHDRFKNAGEMLLVVEDLLALPVDVPQVTTPMPPPKRRVASPEPATRTVGQLESRLAEARLQSDTPTQLSTLRTLYGMYAQLDRRDDALRAYREALVVHVKMLAPANN
ncbi:MAG TPA: serine/threonine-protein kinase [Phycisphaerae bacterium]|jgi:serine/threonine-protein kinase